MKLDFSWSDDNKYHQYCFLCHAETVSRVYEGEKTFYYCSTCKQKHERSIVIDPNINWWLDKNKEYWHESVGVFVRNNEGKFLLFERSIFPFALTVPSGHVDKNEDTSKAAGRELMEEVGIESDNILPIAVENIVGDSCRRGSDSHRWHAYLVVLEKPIKIKVKEEGDKPVWLSLETIKQKDLIFPVKYVINKYYYELKSTNPKPRI